MKEYHHISLRLSDSEMNSLKKWMSDSGQENRSKYIKSQLFSGSESKGDQQELLVKLVELVMQQSDRLEKIEGYLTDLSEELARAFNEDGEA